MKRFLLVISLLSMASPLFSQDSLRVMIITGGHPFAEKAFFEMFDSFPKVSYQEVIQPSANEMIEENAVGQFDVLVFYDMYDTITEGQKEAYLKLLASGKPMIFLHHALVSYQDWDIFPAIIGGKYNLSDSTQAISEYEHDVDIPVQVLPTQHPITDGLTDFTIFDETYNHCQINETVLPLLATNKPTSMPYLGWVNRFSNTQVVYLQLGHGHQAYRNPNFRKLLFQAIHWAVAVNA